MADRVHRQLGAVLGLLWMSSQAADAAATDEELVSDLWSRLGSGDPEAFARQFMALVFRTRADGGSAHELFFGTEVRTRHSNTILDTFGRLLEAGRRCDPDGLIVDALMGSAHGRVLRDHPRLRRERAGRAAAARLRRARPTTPRPAPTSSAVEGSGTTSTS